MAVVFFVAFVAFRAKGLSPPVFQSALLGFEIFWEFGNFGA
jgi:hypothetical protein